MIFSALSGLLSLLAFPPFDWGLLAYIAPLPLFWSLLRLREAGRGKRSFFWVAFVYGLVFMGGFHLWMFELAPFAPIWGIALLWGLFTIYLACFYGLMAVLFRWLAIRYHVILALPTAWTLAEYLRSIGPIGNPAGLLGYSQVSLSLVSPLASLVGVFGVSTFVVTVSMGITLSLYDMTKNGLPEIINGRAALLLFVIAIVLGYAWTYSNTPINESTEPINIAIIQANHAQLDKMNTLKWRILQQDYIDLIDTASKKANLIITPETITPAYNLNSVFFANTILSVLKKHNTQLLLGTPVLTQNGYYNGLVAMSKNGIIDQPYYKVKLMPFGEYWPLRKTLTVLGAGNHIPKSDYRAGVDRFLLYTEPPKSLMIAAGICLESMYPWHYRDMVSRGADILVVVANHAWFFKSSAAAKHLQMSQMRAIETGRYMIYAANTGISAFISPKGTLLTTAPLLKRQVLHHEIGPITGQTPYIQFGDSTVLIAFFLILFRIVMGVRLND